MKVLRQVRPKPASPGDSRGGPGGPACGEAAACRNGKLGVRRKHVNLPRFLAKSAAALERDFRRRLKRCRHGFSREDVHQLRVAARRLRSEWELVAGLAPGLPVKRVRRRLNRWLQACSLLRDTQVQLEFLESRAAAFPESLGFRRALARKERKGARKLDRQLRRVDRLALRESVCKLCQRLRRSSRPGMPRNDWEARAGRALAKAAARVSLRLKAVDPGEARTLHQVRVAFKRYRYLREALPCTLSGLDEQTENAHRDYQRRMGEIQDTQVLREALRDYLADHPGEAGPLRRLAGFLDRRRRALIAGFMRHVDEFDALVSRPG